MNCLVHKTRLPIFLGLSSERDLPRTNTCRKGLNTMQPAGSYELIGGGDGRTWTIHSFSERCFQLSTKGIILFKSVS